MAHQCISLLKLNFTIWAYTLIWSAMLYTEIPGPVPNQCLDEIKYYRCKIPLNHYNYKILSALEVFNVSSFLFPNICVLKIYFTIHI